MPGNITTPRFARMMQKVFGSRSGETGVLIDDIMPVAEVLDPAVPDLRLLRGECLFSQHTGANAQGGLYNVHHFACPAGCGHLMTIESIIFVNDTFGGSLSFALTLQVTAVLPGGSASARDARLVASGMRSVSTIQLTTQAGPPTAANAQVFVPVSGSNILPPEFDFVLSPGYELQVGALTVNAGYHLTFAWSERQAETEELQRMTL
jgi:hypothetical protein